MALSRKMLKAMGIEDEKIDQIIEAHSETVDSLKEQVSAYKADLSEYLFKHVGSPYLDLVEAFVLAGSVLSFWGAGAPF